MTLLVGQGVHDLGEGSHAHFSLLLVILEERHQNALDHMRHLGAQTTEGIDGGAAHDALLGFVGDDFSQVGDAEVDGSVSEFFFLF
jgi:hypothetical protein